MMRAGVMVVTFGLLSFAAEHAAHACSNEPYDPGSDPSVTPALHAVSVQAKQVPRDGGVLLRVDADKLTADEALARVTVTVTADGVPVDGELRTIASAPGALWFRPSSLLPVTKALHVEATYEGTPRANQGPSLHAWDLAVDDAHYANVLVPALNVTLGSVSTYPDPTSPKYTCELPVRSERSGSSCGDANALVTVGGEFTFPSQLVRAHTMTALEATSAQQYEGASFVTKTGRLTWAANPSGMDFVPGTTQTLPAGLSGQVCYELTISSPVLEGFPKTVKKCMTLKPLDLVSPSENVSYIRDQSEDCVKLTAPDGRVESDSTDGGCSLSRARSAGGGASAALVFAAALGLARRRRRA